MSFTHIPQLILLQPQEHRPAGFSILLLRVELRLAMQALVVPSTPEAPVCHLCLLSALASLVEEEHWVLALREIW